MPVKNGLTGRDYVRELVRIRDNRTCQSCQKVWGQGNRRFDVHHLNGLCGKLSKKYDKVENMGGLTTLCHRCHISKHVNKNVLGKNRFNILKNQTNKIKKLKKNKVSLDNIGKIFGVSGVAIRQHLIKHG